MLISSQMLSLIVEPPSANANIPFLVRYVSCPCYVSVSNLIYWFTLSS